MPKDNKIEVMIAGNKFTIISDDKPDYLRKLAKEVDNSIRNLVTTNSGMTVENAAILTALNFYDDIHKMNKQPKEIDDEDRLMKQIIEYSKELSELTAENKRLKKEISDLKNMKKR